MWKCIYVLISQKNYPPDARYDNIIIAAANDGEDILTPEVLKKVF